MARQRLYANAAERQKAHRQRRASPEPPPIVSKRQRVVSRPTRLAAAGTAIETLQQEYEQWRDRLPEFQEGSEQETKLTESIDLLSQALELLVEVQLPKGFGRD